MTQPPEQTILVLSRKKPHLIFLMGLGVITGLSVALGGPVDEDSPLWLSHAWAVMVGITSLVILLSHLWRWDRERGMWIERGALWIQAGGVLAYTMALPTWTGVNAPSILTIVAGAWWAGTNIWEVREIAKDLRLISAVRRFGTGSDDAGN